MVLPTGLQSRPFFIQNTEASETMPAFGAGVIVPGEKVSNTVDGNNVVFKVRRPTASDVSIDTACVVFNGPQEIQPGKKGVASQDYPLRCVSDSTSSNSNATLGLQAGSWLLGSGNDGFRNLGKDASKVIAKTGQEVFWIRPAERAPEIGIYELNGSAEPAESFSFFNGANPPGNSGGGNVFGSTESVNPYDNGIDAISLVDYDGGKAFKFSRHGHWWFTFQAMVRPTEVLDATDEGLLRVSLYENQGHSPYFGQRVHAIDDDGQYGTAGTSSENVAFSGALYVTDSDAKYHFRNASAINYDLYALGYVMFKRIGPPNSG